MGNTSSTDQNGGALTKNDLDVIERTNLRLIQKLGQGCFGEVHQGEWTHNGRKKLVAIKTIKRVAPDVLAEARIQFNLRHPNIVPLHGISISRDLWIVMDLVVGRDLSKILFPPDGRSVVLTFQQKVKISIDICNALSYIHSQNFVHRDIKPNNIMVDQAGKAYVCDFGITKFVGDIDPMTYNAQYTSNDYYEIWYQLYVPPECVQRNSRGKIHTSNDKSDIWSLGAVLFELFSEQRLNTQPQALMEDKRRNDDGWIRRRVNELSSNVRSLVASALNFNPTARPSAGQLMNTFNNL